MASKYVPKYQKNLQINTSEKESTGQLITTFGEYKTSNSPKGQSRFKTSFPKRMAEDAIDNRDAIKIRDSSKGDHSMKNSLIDMKIDSEVLQIQDITSQDSYQIRRDPYLKQLKFNRIKTEIISLQKAKRTILTSLQQYKQFHLRFSSHFSDQLQQKLQKCITLQQEELHQENHALKANILSLELQLKRKTHEIDYLNKEISQFKFQRSRIQSHQGSSIKAQSNCSNCKLLQMKLNVARSDAIENSRKMMKIENENEGLQQQIFDLQQQVIGIDLQVEKRLKEVLNQLPSIGTLTSDNKDEIINSLKRDIQKIQQRCKHYQSLCKENNQIEQRQHELQQNLIQYERKNAALMDAIGRSQQTNNRNYQKEHQLLLAEEQILKKIEELGQKEIELSEWEANLAQKNNAFRVTPSFQAGKSERVKDEQIEISMKNLKPSQAQKPSTSEYYTEHKQKQRHSHQDVENNYIPRLALREKDHDTHSRRGKEGAGADFYNSRFSSQLQSRKEAKDNYYATRINDHYTNKKILGSNSKQALIDKYTIDRHKYSKSKHGGYRERSNSPKSFKSSHVSLSKSNISQRANYSALENKLDRLRDQLKRQIDSIK